MISQQRDSETSANLNLTKQTYLIILMPTTPARSTAFLCFERRSSQAFAIF